jgi:GAF domain-containing protein
MTQRPEDLWSELARTASSLGAALTPAGHDELLRSITAAAKDLFGAAACSLALLDEEEEHLLFHVATGAGADEVVGLRVPVGRGVAGWVVTSGQPIAIADVRRDPRFASDVAQTTGYVPQSILAMPLQTERAMLGVIEVLDRSSDGREDRRDMQLLGLFAEQAALAIENSRVFSDLGRMLLEAAADAAGDGDLGAALRRAARDAPSPTAELAELGALFNELGRAGPDERRLAARIVSEILSYQRTRGREWTS